MTKQVYCVGGCHSWFDSKLSVCPGCGWVRPGFSKHLRTAQLNNHLYGIAEHAEKEKRYEQTMMRGG